LAGVVEFFLPGFVYPHHISKTDAAGITKLDIEMFHHASWKLVYFKIKGKRAGSQGIKTLQAWVVALL